jgi:hypothetical protein
LSFDGGLAVSHLPGDPRQKAHGDHAKRHRGHEHKRWEKAKGK